MTQSKRRSRRFVGDSSAFEHVMTVSLLMALFVLIVNPAFLSGQPILETLIDSLAFSVALVHISASMEGVDRTTRLQDSLKIWSRSVGRCFVFVLTLSGGFSLFAGDQPLWWYVAATCVGLTGVLGVLGWGYLKQIAGVGL